MASQVLVTCGTGTVGRVVVEQLIAASGLPWTVLRASQFHDLIAALLRALAVPPIVVVPAGWQLQPIDVHDVGARLAELALGEPAGRVPDLAGLEVLALTSWHDAIRAVLRRRPK